jgi:SAM-dependent methyltransferase
MPQGESIDKGSRKATLEHYGLEDMTERVARALTDAGLDQGIADGTDLDLLDQFHVRGLAATREMAEGLDLPKGSAVLDVGCGLGGPARYLAARGGWQVTGVDLSPRFIEVARMLAERSGCAEQVKFIQADALDLPFENGTFDGAWTQHVAMNIRDRAGLYSGIRRVLKPGGRLAIYDVVAAEGPLVFPVPWALTAETSFLLKAEAMRESLRETGFSEISWEDKTAEGIAWFEAQRTHTSAQPVPSLGLHIVMGQGFKGMAANLARNLKEGRAGLIQAILRRSEP